MNGQKWEQWEKDFLKRNYGKMPIGAIARTLNRPQKRVISYYHKMNEMEAHRSVQGPDDLYEKRNLDLKIRAEKLNKSISECNNIDTCIQMLKEYNSIQIKLKSRQQKPKRNVDFSFFIASSSTNQYRRMP